VVYKDGTTYRAESLVAAGTDYSNTDAATTIQNALDALTSGRTWKEKVLLKGANFPLSTTLDIPSYTIFELQGKITLNNSVNDAIMNVGDGAARMDDVDIIGGIYDGNKANQTGGHGIRLWANGSGAARCFIHDVYLKDVKVSGISCDSFTDTIISVCRTNGCGSYGFFAENVGSLAYLGCWARSCAGGFGLLSSDTITYTNCHSWNNTQHGFSISSGTGISIMGGTSRGNTQKGVHLTGTNVDIKIHGLFDYDNGTVSDQLTMEHHTANDTLTNAESETTHTNLGAGGAITLTLPQSTAQGIYFDFAVMAAQELRIDPGAAGAVYINGAKQTDDKYISADDEAESVRLMADGNGDWIAISPVGTWSVEA